MLLNSYYPIFLHTKFSDKDIERLIKLFSELVDSVFSAKNRPLVSILGKLHIDLIPAELARVDKLLSKKERAALEKIFPLKTEHDVAVLKTILGLFPVLMAFANSHMTIEEFVHFEVSKPQFSWNELESSDGEFTADTLLNNAKPDVYYVNFAIRVTKLEDEMVKGKSRKPKKSNHWNEPGLDAEAEAMVRDRLKAEQGDEPPWD